MNRKLAPQKKASKEDHPELSKFVKPGMTLDDIVRLKQCFDIFDFDKSGIVSIEELKNSIIALGMQDQASKILTMVKNSKVESEIDFQSFLGLFGFTDDIKTQNSLRHLFDQFDLEKKGYFTLQDFKRVCDSLGERYSDNQIRQMIQHADRDKDKKISYEEFVRVVTKEYKHL